MLNDNNNYKNVFKQIQFYENKLITPYRYIYTTIILSQRKHF